MRLGAYTCALGEGTLRRARSTAAPRPSRSATATATRSTTTSATSCARPASCSRASTPSRDLVEIIELPRLDAGGDRRPGRREWPRTRGSSGVQFHPEYRSTRPRAAPAVRRTSWRPPSPTPRPAARSTSRRRRAGPGRSAARRPACWRRSRARCARRVLGTRKEERAEEAGLGRPARRSSDPALLDRPSPQRGDLCVASIRPPPPRPSQCPEAGALDLPLPTASCASPTSTPAAFACASARSSSTIRTTRRPCCWRSTRGCGRTGRSGRPPAAASTLARGWRRRCGVR